jgi:hypothetical protein
MPDVQLKCTTLGANMANGSDRIPKVGVATMRQGSPRHELSRDRDDRDPDHCRELLHHGRQFSTRTVAEFESLGYGYLSAEQASGENHTSARQQAEDNQC